MGWSAGLLRWGSSPRLWVPCSLRRLTSVGKPQSRATVWAWHPSVSRHREVVTRRIDRASVSFGVMSTAADLIVADLRKEYPTPTTPLVVLKGVNLALSPGERLAIV